MLIRSVLLALLLVTPSLSGQSEKEKPKPKWQPAEITKGVDVDDAAAKAAIEVFNRAFAATKDLNDKKYAMDELAKARNKKVASVFEKILLREKHPALRAQAADCLARLALPESEGNLLKAFAARINKDEDDVLQAIGRALGQVGTKPLFPKIGKQFDEVSKGGKGGMVLAFGYRKDEAALRTLSQWLDRPEPSNPDSPSNPPASYWEQRFAEYHYIRDEVVWAVWRITGELIQSKEEYEAWLEKNKDEGKEGRNGMRRRR